jgi:hypothetical protein
MPAAGAFLVEEGALLESYRDVFTMHATGATAAWTVVGGARLGMVSLAAAGGSAMVAAPLLNGYSMGQLMVLASLERLLYLVSGFCFALAATHLAARTVQRERAAAVARARVNEAGVITQRMADVLAEIAGTPEPGPGARAGAYVGLAWARHRLAGQTTPAAEDLVVALAETASRHLDVVQGRPPQVLAATGCPPREVMRWALDDLDTVLAALEPDAAPVTITARSDESTLRVTLTRPSGPPPPAAAVLAAHGSLSATPGGGFRLVLEAP